MTITTGSRTRSDVVAMIRDVGIIPVIRADSADVAIRIVTALVDAGLPVAEITMTVPDALVAMRQVAQRFSRRILLGAGTVTDAATVPQAIDAGAEFIVSPALVPEVIVAARAANVAVLPGALTPTEILQAVQWGADLVKVFPAQSIGGASYIRALRGPFPTIPLVPTGGVNLQTVGDFIRAGSAAVGIGGELVQKDAIARGDYAGIGVLAREFLDAIRSARGHPERSEGSAASGTTDPSSLRSSG